MKVEICILAGGLSTRMGHDKSRARLGRSTMLRLVRELGRNSGFKVRVVRRDLVPRCGPLGGIYSALKTSRFDAVLFLACDMPFLKQQMIDKLTATAIAHPEQALFFKLNGKLTFPVLIPRLHVDKIALCLKKRELSIQSLGKRLQGKVIPCPRKWLRCLENINTPEDLEWARKHKILGAPASRRRDTDSPS